MCTLGARSGGVCPFPPVAIELPASWAWSTLESSGGNVRVGVLGTGLAGSGTRRAEGKRRGGGGWRMMLCSGLKRGERGLLDG